MIEVGIDLKLDAATVTGASISFSHLVPILSDLLRDLPFLSNSNSPLTKSSLDEVGMV